jgi:hypothetical protein
VDENGQPAHPERKRTILSDEAKDCVYKKLLFGTPACTIIIDAKVFTCTVCSYLIANVVTAG